MTTSGRARLHTVLLGLCAVLALGLTALQPARSEAAWAVDAALARPRAYASTTLLPTGEILVFGGMDEDDQAVVNTTTELIDPMSGTVRLLDARLPGRLHHTVTTARHDPLDRLVVAGGVEWYGGRFHSTDRVDVYLPYAQAWVRGAALRQARSDHGAAPLPGGRVLVTGGNLDSRPLASSEIYDPAADTWRQAAPLPEPRVRFSIAALPDGRVLVAGGLSKIGVPLATSVLYDPDRDRWDGGPELSTARVQHATVVLPGGDVLIIGGQAGGSNTAERYDAARGTFVYAGTLVVPRLVHQAAALPDGRVLITGGSAEVPGRQGWVPMGGAEVWDPATNAWSSSTGPRLTRALGGLVSTPGGIYLIGGIGDGLAARQAIERFALR